LWTAASDGKVTVGWIVRNFSYGTNRWESDAAPYSGSTHPWPWLVIDGLVATLQNPLTLVWFDDHRGKIIGAPISIEQSSGYMPLPSTEPGGGFGKSVAFLIQPTGDTLQRVFSELPDEPIGQILVAESGAMQNEECANATRSSPPSYLDYTFLASTKPTLNDPSTPYDERQDCYYRWHFGKYGVGKDPVTQQWQQVVEGFGIHTIYQVRFEPVGNPPEYPPLHYQNQVTVSIECQGHRVSGDMIYVELQ
jgi:hypothetical protein